MRCCKAALAILVLFLAAACGNVHVAGVATEPNPPPPLGYRAVCSSSYWPFNAVMTSCTPAAGAEQRVVVRAKG